MREATLLLVEDNPDDVELTLRSLERHRVASRVVVARDGVEALDQLFATGNRAGQQPLLPDAIVLDLKLPRLDGFEVLRSVRRDERTRLLPVVVLTSSDEQRDLLESYSLGCNSYVRKPVDFGQFSAAVRQLGLYWLVLNQPPPPVGGKASAASAPSNGT